MDTILGIPPGESYSGIRALENLSMCIKYTNMDRFTFDLVYPFARKPFMLQDLKDELKLNFIKCFFKVQFQNRYLLF